MNELGTTVALNHLRFHAYHGVLPQEKQVGGSYDVSIRLQIREAQDAVLHDKLSGTVNYAEVYEEIKSIMSQPSQLLEHVAGRILRRIFLQHRQVTQASVTVCKINPPIGADCESASVTLTAKNPWHKPFRLLILDFDGTLADTSAVILATMKKAFDEMQFPEVTDEAIRQTIGLPLRDSIATLGPDGMNDTTLIAAVNTYRHFFEANAKHGTTTFPHVVETLRHLSEHGIKIAIATSRSHASVESLCRDLGLSPYISLYVAENDVTQKKPHPEAVLRILSEFSVAADETLVVGDTAYDILMGFAAHCPTCGVTYDNHSQAQLAAAGADATIDKFAYLENFFV